MRIHGTGCGLIDYLYAKVAFSSPAFQAARSLREGDGGLTPGRLVFAEDFERFCRRKGDARSYDELLAAIVGGAAPTSHNLGGPSVVSLAHAAQLLSGSANEVGYYGVRGQDSTGDFLEECLKRLPFAAHRLWTHPGPTPRTDVLSDPDYDRGHGERTFINVIGSAGTLKPEDLPADFYKADLVAFGGTALLPELHDGLTGLAEKAKAAGALTVVNLVYDFRSELTAPGKKWKLGLADDAYGHIDLLVADREEALRTSGASSSEDAIAYFLDRGVGAAIVTEGSRNIRLASRGGLFAPLASTAMPVCEEVNRELAAHPERKGDTTGCGDNFAGGLIAGMAMQMAPGGGPMVKREGLDLREACVWATASGGFACFYVGGTYYETQAGEKRRRLMPYVDAYRRELEGNQL